MFGIVSKRFVLCLITAPFLLSACSTLTMECSQPAPIPQELMSDLTPPRLADDPADIWPAYLDNMEKLGICYSKYDALREAVKARKAD